MKINLTEARVQVSGRPVIYTHFG